jgi:Na+/proline symporter
MLFRLLIVIVFAVLIIVAGIYFSDDLAAVAQKLWALDKAEQEKIKNWIDIGSKLFAGLLFVFAFPSVIYKFIKGQAEKKKPAEGNTTIFNDEVHIGNDFIQGNKTTNKDDQNAG